LRSFIATHVAMKDLISLRVRIIGNSEHCIWNSRIHSMGVTIIAKATPFHTFSFYRFDFIASFRDIAI